MKLSTSIRNFVLVILGVYFFIIAAIIGISALFTAFTVPPIGNRLLQAGIAIFIISWLILGSTGDHTRDGLRNHQIQNDNLFKQHRQRQRPFEMAIWAVIIASALVILTGFLSVYAGSYGWFFA